MRPVFPGNRPLNRESQKSFGGKRGKSGRTNRKSQYLPREIFTSSEKLDRKPGNWWTTNVKKSAEGIVDKQRAIKREMEDSRNIEGLNLLTKESIEDA
jgi:hypothetical protein